MAVPVWLVESLVAFALRTLRDDRMTEIKLRVDGKPTGKGRPRFSTKTGRAYTDDKTKLGEARVIEAWNLAGCPRLPDGPVTLTATVAVARPQNHWRVDGSLSAAGVRAPHPIRKPDVDNALKLIMDSLNGCAYRDDVDVVHAWIYRRWCNPGEHEHTVITLSPSPQPLAALSRKAA